MGPSGTGLVDRGREVDRDGQRVVAGVETDRRHERIQPDEAIDPNTAGGRPPQD